MGPAVAAPKQEGTDIFLCTYIGNACFCHPLGGHLLYLAASIGSAAVLSSPLANEETKSRQKEIFSCAISTAAMAACFYCTETSQGYT